MKRGSALFAAVIAFAVTTASGAERQPELPLVVNGDVSLTTTDFEAYLQKVPDNIREDFRRNLQRVKPTVDGLWIQRMIGAKARAAGLADDPVIAARLRQAADQILADAYLQQEDKKLKIPDLTARAQEIYKTRPEEFKLPEQVHVQHILVATNCRGREEALQRAKDIHARVANAGEAAFLAEVEKSSEDPSKEKNKGDLGVAPVTAFEAPFAQAVAKLKKPGEVSAPVETKYGIHIIRLVRREPDRIKPFSEVKEGLVALERQKLIDAERTRQVNLVRDDPKTHLYLENVEALTAPRNQASLTTDPKSR
jgi:peptidyl-prolyl cis-trans isomerase C